MALHTFKTLHEQQKPFLLGNAWDAHSAKLIEEAGFQAIGTSSHGIAFALGYADGEEIPVYELQFMIERIVKSVSIPVSVDFEAGYSDDPATVAEYVQKLSDMGVVGINLEDGIVTDGKRELGSMELLCDKIKAIKESCDIFINARTDAYTTKQPEVLKVALERTEAYKEAGADGIFVPLMETAADIKEFTEAIDLPLNLFLTGNLPTYEELSKLGVKRISHGAKLYDWMMAKTSEAMKALLDTKKLPK